MISDKLIRLVESRADRLVREWAESVRSHPMTASFQSIEEFELEDRVHEVYEHLGSYLDRSSYNEEEVAHFFTQIGQNLYDREIPLNEVTYAIILTRRRLWDFISEEHQFTTTLEWYQVSEFSQRVMQFFDKSLYFVVYGYEHATDSERTRKDTVSKVLHAFSMGVLPEVELEESN